MGAGAFWSPFGGPLQAVYDDYGCVKLLQSRTNQTWLTILFEDLLKYAAVTESDDTHDAVDFATAVSIDREEIYRPSTSTEAEFYRELRSWWSYVWARSSRLFVCLSSHSLPRPLTFAVLHAEAMAEILALVQRTGTPQEPMDPKGFFERALCSAEARVEDEKPAKDKERAGDEEDERESFQRVLLRHGLRLRLDGLASSLEKMQGGAPRFYRQAVSGWRNPLITDRRQLFELFEPYLELGYLLRGLELLNLQFSPMVVARKDRANEAGLAYAEFVHTVSEKVRRLR